VPKMEKYNYLESFDPKQLETIVVSFWGLSITTLAIILVCIITIAVCVLIIYRKHKYIRKQKKQ